MARVRVHTLAISLDGCVSGPEQSLTNPLGINDPPFHHPVFVLTHHAREPVHMDGGTTFHFVTEGIEAALEGRPVP